MNTILEQINSMGQSFVEFAWPMLAQSSVLIVILLLVDFLLRKRVRAVFRYWLWMLVLLKLILPSSLSLPVSVGYWFGDELANVKVSDLAVSVNPAGMPQAAESAPVEVGSEAPAATPREAVEPAVSETVSSAAISAAAVTWQGVVFLAWLAVVVVMALLLLQRAIFVIGLVAQAKNADSRMTDAFEYCRGRIGIKGKVGLKVSANATSPAVCGLFRPVVLLPKNLGPKLQATGLRAVLMHELAHIKRGDLWVNLAQTLLQIAYFYNPLLWLANCVIRRVREQAVDEMVQVAMGEKARQYPQMLVNVAKLAFKRPALSLRLIGVVESKSALKGRIKRMLNRPIPKSAKLGVLGLVAVLIIGAVLLPMASAKSKNQSDVLKAKTLYDQAEKIFHTYKAADPNEKKPKMTEALDLYQRAYENAASDLNLASSAMMMIGLSYNHLGDEQAEIETYEKATALFPDSSPATHYYLGTAYHRLGQTQEAIAAMKKCLTLCTNRGPNAFPYSHARNTLMKLGLKPWQINEINYTFTATLTKGVKIELVGVCEHPSAGKQWWQPDGTLLNETPYKTTGSLLPEHANYRYCEFVIRLQDADDISVKWDVPGGRQSSFTGNPMDANGQRISDLQVYTVNQPEDQKTALVRIGLSTAQWQTIATHPVEIPEETYSIDENEAVAFGRSYEKDSKTVIPITHNINRGREKKALRVVAVTYSGREVRGSVSGRGGNILSSNTHEFNLPLRDIKEFRFQTRSYEWITFKNVSLQPGVKTDVQVEVEKPDMEVEDENQSSRSSLREKLQAAIAGGDIDKVQKLIEEGVSVNMPGKEGMTPVRWAVDAGQKEIVELLIRNGANVDAPDDYGNTPLHISGTKPQADTAKYLEIAGVLIASGADLNAKARSNRTPLHLCAKYGNKDISELLVASRASIDVKDDFGKTPLLYAAGVHKNVSELLIENGADVATKDKYGQTPLHLAANWGHEDIVRLFIEKGVDVNAKDNNGLTPLDYATKKRYREVMKLLVANGGYSVYKLENVEVKRVYVPDVDDKAVMLDLASGELVDIPEPVTGLEVLAAIEELDKGDITYDNRSLIFVRGATSNISGVHPGPGSVKVYEIGNGWLLPERMIVTSCSGEQYELTIIVANKLGCRINYYRLEKNKPAVQVEDMKERIARGPEQVQAIDKMLREWFGACVAGDAESMKKAYSPGYQLVERDMRQINELLGMNPSWQFSLLAVMWDEDEAMAVSGALEHGDPKVGGPMVLVWTFNNSEDKWGIIDIDLEELEGLQIENSRFMQKHPNAQVWFDNPDLNAPKMRQKTDVQVEGDKYNLMARGGKGHVEAIDPNAADMIRRYLRALGKSDWKTALSMCSIAVMEEAQQYPTPESFFNTVVPVKGILNKLRNPRIGYWQPPPKYFAYIFDVRISQPDLPRDTFWVWKVRQLEGQANWEIDFPAIPFETWLANEKREIIRVAQEKEQLIKKLAPRLKGVRILLTAQREEFVIGEPVCFRLQLINRGDSVLNYDCQQVAVNNSMTIEGPDGREAKYTARYFQTVGATVLIEPGETKTLLDQFDITKQYDIKQPGQYRVQFNGNGLFIRIGIEDISDLNDPTSYEYYPGILPSNVVTITIHSGVKQYKLDDGKDRVEGEDVGGGGRSDAAVYERLKRTADVSELTAEMAFGEALEVLKESVEPPLQIIVLWRDLYDNADIEKTTPINMDGVSGIRLGTALKLLLKSVSGGFAELGYVVDGGAIVIATKESLPHKLETRVYDTSDVLSWPADYYAQPRER